MKEKNKISLNDKIVNFVSNNIVWALLILSFFCFSSCGYLGLLKPDKNKFPLTGIDISHHQNDIQWLFVKNEISFVFVKATEGSDYIDNKFNSNIDSIKKYKIPYSAYHFFTFCSTGKEQAKNFISNFQVDTNALPPVLDLEFLGNCNKKNVSDYDVKKEVQDYLDTIQNHYNKIPIIYTTYDFYNKYLVNDFKQYHFWIRDLFKEPKLKDNKEFVFWQYSNCGKINGINGNVDMNVFKGNIDELNALSNHPISSSSN